MTEVMRGPLILADISGYSRYLGGVELEHSHDILADLLRTVVGGLRGPLELAKLEGDAAFCVDPADGVDGDLLMELVEGAYFGFARRKRTIETRTSCECDACRRVTDLGLKLLSHHGSFVRHDVAGSPEVLGADVVLAHRLLKNSVVEATGIREYALFTDASVARSQFDPSALGMVRHIEHYDDAGTVEGWVRDLDARWREEDARRTVMVEPGDADVALERELRAAPAVVWHQLTDPRAQLRWRLAATEIDSDAATGERGVGSATHCVHGKQAFDQEIVDWKPLRYFSYREVGPIGAMLWTFELDPRDGNESTYLSVRIALTGGRIQRLARPVIRSRLARVFAANLQALERALLRP
jgi:uncharacterized protein YndB with AHSA1/START domain